ncbi:MAG: hypothetical protein KatS3mg110_3300 [Pirellulaceae bacterium]|nr:MAG: hypothetical protein KatS3mg110_3300 [Pirellulaceae bacterium]
MAGEVHVLVGCGGSGIRTLRRLNELLSEDVSWRRRMDRDIYYVVVDTDVDEIEQFQNAVREHLRGMPQLPHIMQVALSSGETHLQPLVDRYMVDPFRDRLGCEPQMRLLEHWWHRGAADPFRAPAVRPLRDGAGQCPPVSYFLTWKKLHDIEQQFENLIREIQRRKGGLGRYDDINLVIVAGLAGGTGRGSWELIAFKLRELFSRYGRAPTPRAFLYDASIFSDLFLQITELQVPMMVNSLTGMSQLACWTLNRQKGHIHRDAIFQYRLPNLESPQDPETDVLKVDLELDVNNAAPVDHAYLIFKENQMTQLANHEQYYEMVAAGIYGALTKSAITRTQINQRFSYLGVATATFEVGAVSLRRYFERLARMAAVRRLLEGDAARVTQSVALFWEKTALGIPTREEFLPAYQPDPHGTFLQRVLARVEAKMKFRLDQLATVLNEQKVDDAVRLAEGIKRKDEEQVEAAFQEVLATLPVDPVRLATDMAQKLLDETASLTSVDEFVFQLCAGLRSAIDELPAEIGFGRQDLPQMVREFSNRELPAIWIRFSDQEKKKINETARFTLLRAQYAAIRPRLRQQYQKWIDQLQQLVERVRNARETATRLERRYQLASEQELAEAGGATAFERLFGPPDRPEEAIDQRFSEKRFYRRELKPLLAKGDDLKLVQRYVHIHPDVTAILREAIFFPGTSDPTALRDQLLRQLQSKVDATVGIPVDFITENFSLQRVVRDIMAAWRRRLEENWTDDERYQLEQRFKEMFGFQPMRRKDVDQVEYDFPENVTEMFCHMAASLARTCKPFWVLNRRQDERFNVSLFLPCTADRAWLKDRVQTLLQQEGATYVDVEVYPEASGDGGTGGSNPFLLLAYSTQGVDSLNDIESLRYYNKPEVLQLLREAENEDGATIFEGGRNGGLGYTDPLYVKDEQIRGYRWCPWVSEETITRKNERLAIEALFYALFPGHDRLTPDLEQLRGALEQFGWSMPLIVNKGNWYRFTRLPLELDGDAVRTDPSMQGLTGWDRDNAVARQSGIASCFRVLKGDDAEKGDVGRNYRDRILKEARLFWDQVLRRIDIASGTPKYKKLLTDYRQWLGDRSREVARDDDQARDIWQQLIDYANDLLKEQDQ